MKIVLLLFFSVVFLYSQGIDSLLNSYEAESEFSKKTKDEGAGNLIVYTRDDLERMQVETLKDLLKSLRFFSYTESRLGQPDILNQDPLIYYSKSVRVYLNETELLTAITGSGLIMFGNMEMDFIDHVEIYEGFPSFDFGTEPATIVIRLYSKTPEHDEGGRVKATVGSYGSNKENVYYTNIEDGLSYFFYANRSNDNQESYEHNGETLRRDKQTNRFYGSLATTHHTLEVQAVQVQADAFIGSLVGNTPRDTAIETSYINVALNSKYFDDTLIVNLAYMNSTNIFSYNYDPSAPIVILTSSGYIPITTLDQTIKDEAFTASIKKIWNIDAHNITLGTQYRYKHFDLTDVTLRDLYFNRLTSSINQAYSRENVYSLFVQDMIAINSNNMISLSAMDQFYDRVGDIKDINTLQLRLGYIYSDEKFVAKTFLSRQQFAPEPYMVLSPSYGNTDLDKETYISIFQEFSYKTPSLLSKVILGYGTNENIAILDKNFKIQNSNTDIDGYSAALEFTFFFSQKDKLELQTNYTYIESPYGNAASKHYNHVIRMLNTVSKFDIFNELIIHSGYKNVQTGYDYSVGAKYALSKDLHVSMKGDNIFNSGLKNSYINQIDPATRTVTDTVVVPVVERRFIFGLEYLF